MSSAGAGRAGTYVEASAVVFGRCATSTRETALSNGRRPRFDWWACRVLGIPADHVRVPRHHLPDPRVCVSSGDATLPALVPPAGPRRPVLAASAESPAARPCPGRPRRSRSGFTSPTEPSDRGSRRARARLGRNTVSPGLVAQCGIRWPVFVGDDRGRRQDCRSAAVRFHHPAWIPDTDDAALYAHPGAELGIRRRQVRNARQKSGPIDAATCRTTTPT